MENRMNHGEPALGEARYSQWTIENDEVIFVPKEFIRSFENIIDTVKMAQQELIRVGEAMKPMEN